MLTLKVEAGAGDDIRDILTEMCLLAARTGCLVVADINQIATMAKPGADPRELYSKWQDEIASNRRYKMVCGHPIEIPRDKMWDKFRPQLGKNEGQTK